VAVPVQVAVPVAVQPDEDTIMVSSSDDKFIRLENKLVRFERLYPEKSEATDDYDGSLYEFENKQTGKITKFQMGFTDDIKFYENDGYFKCAIWKSREDETNRCHCVSTIKSTDEKDIRHLINTYLILFMVEHYRNMRMLFPGMFIQMLTKKFLEKKNFFIKHFDKISPHVLMFVVRKYLSSSRPGDYTFVIEKDNKIVFNDKKILLCNQKWIYVNGKTRYQHYRVIIDRGLLLIIAKHQSFRQLLLETVTWNGVPTTVFGQLVKMADEFDVEKFLKEIESEN